MDVPMENCYKCVTCGRHISNGEHSAVAGGLASAADRHHDVLADPARRRGHPPLQRPAATADTDHFDLRSGTKETYVTSRNLLAL